MHHQPLKTQTRIRIPIILLYSRNHINGMPVSTYVSINSDNGNIYALRSFDHEQLRNFQIVVQAEDAGFPPLRANVTVNVFVLDQNDNPPALYTRCPRMTTAADVVVPRYADAGYLVVKITAMDADAGQNSRLFYEVLQATDLSLFSVALYTGEIRTIRRLMDNDPRRQRLVVWSRTTVSRRSRPRSPSCCQLLTACQNPCRILVTSRSAPSTGQTSRCI